MGKNCLLKKRKEKCVGLVNVVVVIYQLATLGPVYTRGFFVENQQICTKKINKSTNQQFVSTRARKKINKSTNQQSTITDIYYK
jgi:hypothetical protein